MGLAKSHTLRQFPDTDQEVGPTVGHNRLPLQLRHRELVLGRHHRNHLAAFLHKGYPLFMFDTDAYGPTIAGILALPAEEARDSIRRSGLPDLVRAGLF